MSKTPMFAAILLGACANEGTSPDDSVPAPDVVEGDPERSPFFTGDVTPDDGSSPYSFVSEGRAIWAAWGVYDGEVWGLDAGGSGVSIWFTFTGRPTVGQKTIGTLADAHQAQFTESGTFEDDEDTFFSVSGTFDVTGSEMIGSGAQEAYVVEGTYDIHFDDGRKEPSGVEADVSGSFSDILVPEVLINR